MGLVGRQMAALGAASALWLSLGIVTALGDGTTSRIGLFPPAWLLVVLLLVGTAAAWLIRTHGSSSLVWLPAFVLLLPWLPIVVPTAALLWTGPLTVLIWLTIAVALCRLLLARPGSASIASGAAAASGAPLASIASRVSRAAAPLVQHPVRAPIVAGLLAAALYLCAGWQLSA